MKKLKFEELEKKVDKFSELYLARRYAERSIKIKMIVLGDDGKYWLGKPAITEQLVKDFGYEYA